MHTHSSPPNSNHSNTDEASHTSTGAEGNVWWLLADKIVPIDFPIVNKEKVDGLHQENVNGLTMTCKHLNKIENMPDKQELHVPW